MTKLRKEAGPVGRKLSAKGMAPSVLWWGGAGASLGMAFGLAAGVREAWPVVSENGYLSQHLWGNAFAELLPPVCSVLRYAVPAGLALLPALWLATRPVASRVSPKTRSRLGWIASGLRTSLLALGALAIVLLAASGAALPSRLARTADGRPNIIILCIDALRADHLGCYGYARDTSPTIDSLAARGDRFQAAFAQGPMTRISVSTLFTSLYPQRHGVIDRGQILAPKFTTLAERLREGGYRTAAFMPNPNLKKELGYAQGFDYYDDDILYPKLLSDPYGKGKLPDWQVYETAAKLQDRAKAWLADQGGRPFFLYIHYRDVHIPYVPPPPYDTRYYSPADAEKPRVLTPQERGRMLDSLRLKNDHNDLNYYLSQYDGEIRYTDDRIAEFIAHLESQGILEKSVLIVTADHGEAFLDHGQWNHGSALYDEEIRVPLILVRPGPSRAGSTIEDPVGLVDLAPTLLDMVGIPVAPAMQGRSLRPLIDGEVLAPRPILSQNQELRSIRTPDWKLITSLSGKPLALFDLRQDPRETTDLREAKPDVLKELQSALAAHYAEKGKKNKTRKADKAHLDKETIDQMKSLGYAQ